MRVVRIYVGGEDLVEDSYAFGEFREKAVKMFGERGCCFLGFGIDRGNGAYFKGEAYDGVVEGGFYFDGIRKVVIE